MLDHYACACSTMKEQMQNLLNLVGRDHAEMRDAKLTDDQEFNSETVSHTLAVTRLSVLAFIFVPLSFVAVS
jgi:hypothetical protein